MRRTLVPMDLPNRLSWVMREWVHLAKRFFGSLSLREPEEADRLWVRSLLSDGEFELWERQSVADRRHSLSLARRLEIELARRLLVPARIIDGVSRLEQKENEAADGPFGSSVAPDSVAPDWLYCAVLLHDVGKVQSQLGTFGRVFATLVGKFVRPETPKTWQHLSGLRGRLGRYLCHSSIGAEMLREVNSDENAVLWASLHHKPPSDWEVPAVWGQLLHALDNA